MKNSMKALLLAIVAVLLALNFSSLFGNDDPDKITWHKFVDALKKAKAENKMIVVDFYTDWCGFCKKMDKNTYGNSDIIKFAAEKLVMAKVNAESNEQTTYKGKNYTYRQLSAGFGVTGFPTTVFISPQGEYITDVAGYLTADKFLPMLEFLEGKHYEKMKYDEFLKKRGSK